MGKKSNKQRAQKAKKPINSNPKNSIVQAYTEIAPPIEAYRVVSTPTFRNEQDLEGGVYEQNRSSEFSPHDPFCQPPPTSIRTTTTTTITDTDLEPCSFMFNILWLVCSGGLIISLIYFTFALLFTMTIVGAPCGYQLFKLGKLALSPFGSELQNYKRDDKSSCIGSSCNCIFILLANLIWLPLGIFLVLLHTILGVISFCSIVGIPFAYAHFRLACLAVCPFGVEVCGGGRVVEERHEYTTIITV